MRGRARWFGREFRHSESLDLRSRLSRRPSDIEENKTAGVSSHGRLRPSRLHVRIQSVNPLHCRTRFSGSSLGVEGFMEDLELLDRLRVLARLRELVGEHQPDVVLTRTEVRELLQRLEGIAFATGAVHPVGVFAEILLGVAVEALLGRDLTELVVDLVARRGVAEDFVAQGDRVVEVAALGIQIDRLLVIIHGLVGLVQAQIEVANPVVDGDVPVVVALGLFDYRR